jgi:hypothetical protein
MVPFPDRGLPRAAFSAATPGLPVAMIPSRELPARDFDEPLIPQP